MGKEKTTDLVGDVWNVITWFFAISALLAAIKCLKNSDWSKGRVRKNIFDAFWIWFNWSPFKTSRTLDEDAEHARQQHEAFLHRRRARPPGQLTDFE